MNCPKCGGHMTMLFVSYVCDACDPPKVAGGSARREFTKPSTRKKWRYWIECSRSQQYGYEGGYDGCWTPTVSLVKDSTHTVQVESDVEMDVTRLYSRKGIIIYSQDKRVAIELGEGWGADPDNAILLRVLSPDEADDA